MILCLLPLAISAIKYGVDYGSMAYGAHEGYQQGITLDNISNAVEANGQALSGLGSAIDSQSIILSSIATSVSVLGVASIAGIALSGFALKKIIDLGKDIKNLESKIENGMVDLKYFIDEGFENLIDYHQKTKLSEAYQLYRKGIVLVQKSFVMNDRDLAKQSLITAINRFDEALVLYDSQKEFQSLEAAGKIRQLETILTVEVAKAESYMILGEKNASIDFYHEIKNKICSELKNIAQMANKDNIDFVISDTQYLYHNDMRFIQGLIASNK